MNILTTKHHEMPVMSPKGQSLGRVGIFMVVGLVGIIFATSLIMVQATTNNEVVKIEQNGNTLSATANYNNVDDLDLNWSWFRVNSDVNPNFSNSKQLAERCNRIYDRLETSAGSVLNQGSNSEVTISSEGYNSLYCFVVNTNDDRTDFGGYIPTRN